MPCPSHVLRGVKVQAARAGRQPCGRLPITLQFFINLEESGYQVPKLSTTLLWAAATTTFFGFCRITVESKKGMTHIFTSHLWTWQSKMLPLLLSSPFSLSTPKLIHL